VEVSTSVRVSYSVHGLATKSRQHESVHCESIKYIGTCNGCLATRKVLVSRNYMSLFDYRGTALQSGMFMKPGTWCIHEPGDHA